MLFLDPLFVMPKLQKKCIPPRMLSFISCNLKRTDTKRYRFFQTVEKASQSFLRKQKIKLKTFSAGACTWQKILLRLQVWNLSAISRQMMRAADCKELAESPEGDFRQAQRTDTKRYRFFFMGWIIGFGAEVFPVGNTS